VVAWASVAGSKGGVPPPWIFKHGTNIIDRGLKVLFFGRFSVFLPGKFSADALGGSAFPKNCLLF